MVNENHFRFDRKNFFNFWKTIYGFKNRKSFSEIKLLVLVCMFDIRLQESSNDRLSKSRRRWNSATSGHRNTDSTELWRLPAIFAGCRWTRFRPKIAGFGQTCSPESGNGDRKLPDSSDSCIFAFRDFFVHTKHRKYFREFIFLFLFFS